MVWTTSIDCVKVCMIIHSHLLAISKCCKTFQTMLCVATGVRRQAKPPCLGIGKTKAADTALPQTGCAAIGNSFSWLVSLSVTSKFELIKRLWKTWSTEKLVEDSRQRLSKEDINNLVIRMGLHWISFCAVKETTEARENQGASIY